MNFFIPKKFLIWTIVSECFSRIAIIFALFQIPVLVKDFSVERISFFLGAIFLFALFHFFSQKLSLSLGGAAKKKIQAYFQNRFLNMLPIRDRAQRGMPLQELSLHYIKTADLMEPWYSRFLPSAYLAATLPCIILGVMFFIDKLTFMILSLTGILLPLFLFLIGKIAKKKSEEQWQSFSKLRAFFLESLQGYKTIKIFKKVKERERDLEIAETEFGKKTLAVLKVAFLSALAQEWIGSLSIALIAVSLALRLMNGSMEFDGAFLALLIAPEFYRPIRHFGTAFHVAINAKTAWNSSNNGEWRMENGEYFQFSILNSQLKLPAQKSLIYISGPAGCGKTRMVLEMLGHIEPQNTQTKLLYDGDKSNIAWMPQNPVWFKGTLLENLCPVEQRDFLEVKSALENVNLGHFTSRLNEQVLEYANNFSGGEKRRLALARIILLNRPVWILDEPFAGLDKINVEMIEKFLEQESKTKSILCISHNAETLARAKMVFDFSIF
ncbi:MAG: ATP-binding cassette domain-containing protein [Fibromonadales bacterium]|nr:ATP-binding cassette domain-containing protein [Fibromonadales bacterium]